MELSSHTFEMFYLTWRTNFPLEINISHKFESQIPGERFTSGNVIFLWNLPVFHGSRITTPTHKLCHVLSYLLILFYFIRSSHIYKNTIHSAKNTYIWSCFYSSYALLSLQFVKILTSWTYAIFTFFSPFLSFVFTPNYPNNQMRYQEKLMWGWLGRRGPLRRRNTRKKAFRGL